MDWLASQRETARGWHRTVESVTAALRRLRIAKDSRNGEVGVTVDSHGRVQDIRLNPQALELRPEQLAQLILEIIKSAERDAAKHAADLSRPITDDPRVTETLRAANELLGQPALSGPSQPAKPKTDSQVDELVAAQPDCASTPPGAGPPPSLPPGTASARHSPPNPTRPRPSEIEGTTGLGKPARRATTAVQPRPRTANQHPQQKTNPAARKIRASDLTSCSSDSAEWCRDRLKPTVGRVRNRLLYEPDSALAGWCGPIVRLEIPLISVVSRIVLANTGPRPSGGI